MAQVARTTSNVQNINVAALQSTITSLKSKFVNNGTIFAADLNNIVNVYNAIITHTHSVDEVAFSAFGNTYDYDTTASVVSSAGIKGHPAGTPNLTAGSTIQATTQQTFASAINGLRTHTHTITDRLWTDAQGDQ